MKITIDTKEDSHEDIRKIIKMLSSLVGEQEVLSNQADIFSDDSSQNGSQGGGSDIFNIFDSSGSENKADEDKENNKEEGDIDIPELEEYH